MYFFRYIKLINTKNKLIRILFYLKEKKNRIKDNSYFLIII